MEADVEKWPWEHTELSRAPQVAAEAPYLCRSLALWSFLFAAPSLWCQKNGSEATQEKLTQIYNFLFWRSFLYQKKGCRPQTVHGMTDVQWQIFSWQLTLYQCVPDINCLYKWTIKSIMPSIHHLSFSPSHQQRCARVLRAMVGGFAFYSALVLMGKGPLQRPAACPHGPPAPLSECQSS